MSDTAPAGGFCSAATQVPPHTLIGGPENIKLLFDEVLDNRREVLARQRAYEDLNLRRAQNAATFDHLVSMLSVNQMQTGTVESQQTVSPIRTGAADTEVQQPAGAVYPPIRNVDQTGATATGVVQTALSSVAAQIAALTDIVTKLADALVPVIVTASGGASTPSQTQPKSTA